MNNSARIARPAPLILEPNSDESDDSGDGLGTSGSSSSYASSDQERLPQIHTPTDIINAEIEPPSEKSLLFGLPKISKSNSEDIHDLRSRTYLNSKLRADQQMSDNFKRVALKNKKQTNQGKSRRASSRKQPKVHSFGAYSPSLVKNKHEL